MLSFLLANPFSLALPLQQVYDTQTWEMLQEASTELPGKGFDCVAVNPGHPTLLVTSGKGIVNLWNVRFLSCGGFSAVVTQSPWMLCRLVVLI